MLVIGIPAYNEEKNIAKVIIKLQKVTDKIIVCNDGSLDLTGFNEFYYTFSPTIADWKRESPMFKEVVKLTLTPMISSLSILNYVDMDSEVSVLGYGISLIILNVGMYFVAPAVVIHSIRKKYHF